VSDAMRILLTGGGTGGHVYPALAVATCGTADESRSVEFRYVGTSDGLERGIVAKAGLQFETVDAGAVRGRSPSAALGGLMRSARGLAQARRIIDHFRPHAVLATGGFVCVPVVLAARSRGVPSVVYLPDLRPGWAVRFLARFASAVAVSFDEVKPHIPSRRVVVTGYPVRPELMRWSREEALRKLELPEDAPVILVIGGSRGARTINNAVGHELGPLLERAWVVHATGAQNYQALDERRQLLPENLQGRYRLYPYLEDELAPAMAAATLVIARSGASVLGELPAVGVPGLLVPYPHAGAHQRLNADFLARRGVVEIVDDAAAQQGALITSALELIQSPQRLDRMARAARDLARPNAAAELFRLVAEVSSSRVGSSVERLA